MAGKDKSAESTLFESEDAFSLDSSEVSAVETIAFDAQSARYRNSQHTNPLYLHAFMTRFAGRVNTTYLV